MVDSIDHKILLAKLSNYGFRGPKNNTIVDDHHSCRPQYVLVKGNQSDIAQIVTGIPQGSVTGPLLLLVSIKDFPGPFKLIMKLHFHL